MAVRSTRPRAMVTSRKLSPAVCTATRTCPLVRGTSTSGQGTQVRFSSVPLSGMPSRWGPAGGGSICRCAGEAGVRRGARHCPSRRASWSASWASASGRRSQELRSSSMSTRRNRPGCSVRAERSRPQAEAPWRLTPLGPPPVSWARRVRRTRVAPAQRSSPRKRRTASRTCASAWRTAPSGPALRAASVRSGMAAGPCVPSSSRQRTICAGSAPVRARPDRASFRDAHRTTDGPAAPAARAARPSRAPMTIRVPLGAVPAPGGTGFHSTSNSADPCAPRTARTCSRPAGRKVSAPMRATARPRSSATTTDTAPSPAGEILTRTAGPHSPAVSTPLHAKGIQPRAPSTSMTSPATTACSTESSSAGCRAKPSSAEVPSVFGNVAAAKRSSPRRHTSRRPRNAGP